MVEKVKREIEYKHLTKVPYMLTIALDRQTYKGFYPKYSMNSQEFYLNLNRVTKV